VGPSDINRRFERSQGTRSPFRRLFDRAAKEQYTSPKDSLYWEGHHPAAMAFRQIDRICPTCSAPFVVVVSTYARIIDVVLTAVEFVSGRAGQLHTALARRLHSCCSTRECGTDSPHTQVVVGGLAS
jgi:hypothetical protein